MPRGQGRGRTRSTGGRRSDAGGGRAGRGDAASGGLSAGRELVVVARREVGLRVTRAGVASTAGADVDPLVSLLRSQGASLERLFGPSEERLRSGAGAPIAATGVPAPDLSVYYRVEAPDERLDELTERLREQEAVEAAYVKPPVALPELNDMAPSADEPPVETPDFSDRQGYLGPAPGGIDALYAWTMNGGSGSGVRIVDIEGAWRFTHEDLLQNQGGVVGGVQANDLRWRNHGTAVVGAFGADRTPFGVTGICPEANARAISVFGGLGSAAAIRQAADMLNPGDIILIELHRPGPRFDFQNRPDQRGFVAIEWWPDDYEAIAYAVSRGVIVVQAAGNGAEDLDDPIYDVNPGPPFGPFPAWWQNPYRRSTLDSGAIVVGAGAPPPGTHGRDHGPDGSRLGFSNWGALVDAQGWGREVTTAGYGDLQGGASEDAWYTDLFSGTSSASPIVVGALGCLQGILRANGGQPLSPAQARQLLRDTGSPQQDAPDRPRTQRIGNRPDLRQLVARALPEDDPARVAELEALLADKERRVAALVNILGYLTGDVARALRNALGLRRLRELKEQVRNIANEIERNRPG